MANAGDPIVITMAQYDGLADAMAAKPGLLNYRQEGSYFMADEPGVGSVIIGRLPNSTGATDGSGQGTLETLLRALGADGQLNKGTPDETGTAAGFLDAGFSSLLDGLKLPTLPKWFWWALVAGVALIAVGSAGKGKGGGVRRYARQYAAARVARR